jgi:hypothetical protein
MGEIQLGRRVRKSLTKKGEDTKREKGVSLPHSDGWSQKFSNKANVFGRRK